MIYILKKKITALKKKGFKSIQWKNDKVSFLNDI